MNKEMKDGAIPGVPAVSDGEVLLETTNGKRKRVTTPEAEAAGLASNMADSPTATNPLNLSVSTAGEDEHDVKLPAQFNSQSPVMPCCGNGVASSVSPCDNVLLTTRGHCPADVTKMPHLGAVFGPARDRQQMRPSVITCVPALHRAKAHGGNSGNSSNNAFYCCTSVTSPEHNKPGPTSDPVVEEHFRRSLGQDYRETGSVSVTGSVDDHFAKALGDAWLRLKTEPPSHSPDIAETTDCAVGTASPSGNTSATCLPSHSQASSVLS
uniref:Vestigial like family member 4 n=1 Tax=Eptatretus burgeri TaxID=7764 RepID=A0A8C4QG96_EPTBU